MWKNKLVDFFTRKEMRRAQPTEESPIEAVFVNRDNRMKNEIFTASIFRKIYNKTLISTCEVPGAGEYGWKVIICESGQTGEKMAEVIKRSQSEILWISDWPNLSLDSQVLKRVEAVFAENVEVKLVLPTEQEERIFNGHAFVLKNLLTDEDTTRFPNTFFRREHLLEEQELLSNLHIYHNGAVHYLMLAAQKTGKTSTVRCRQEIRSTFNNPEEAYTVTKFLLENYLVSCQSGDKILSALYELAPTQTGELAAILRKNTEKYSFLRGRKNIMIIAPDLEVGGGQILVIRIANFLSMYHNVYLYNARPQLKNQSIVDMIQPSVYILQGTGEARDLQKYLKEYSIDIVNSHIWWSDKLAYYALKDNKNVRWVLCMHGCYETLIDNPDWDCQFNEIVAELLNLPDHVIYATDKNKRIFNKIKMMSESKLHKVYYGYEKQGIPSRDRKSLQIDEDSIIFGMVARGIKEKGWQQAIDAVIRLRKDVKCDLILIASGEYIEELKQKYQDEKYIHFNSGDGYASEWISFVKIFDIALLPTYFSSESLPNSVIEYLAYDKPTIATDIGDIKYMITNEEYKNAGILVPLNEGKPNEDRLYEGMKRLAIDPALRLELGKNAQRQFAQFDMNNFMNTYMNYFLNQ